MTAVFLVTGLYILLYLAISSPYLNTEIKNILEKELSELFGGKLTIGEISIKPFNEVIIENVSLEDPDGKPCIFIEKLGAGINLKKLVIEREIEATFAELLNFDISISQKNENEDFNIQFLIDALSPKDKNKEPAHFKLKLRNVVIRSGTLTFDRDWQPLKTDSDVIDINHIKLKDIRADVALPLLSDKGLEIDVRRLALNAGNNFVIDKLSFRLKSNPNNFQLSDFKLSLPSSLITISDIVVRMQDGDFKKALSEDVYFLDINSESFTPSDFRFFYSPLRLFNDALRFNISLEGSLDYLQNIRLDINDKDLFNLFLQGNCTGLSHFEDFRGELSNFSLTTVPSFYLPIINSLSNNDQKITKLCEAIGRTELGLSGCYFKPDGWMSISGDLLTNLGELDLDATGKVNDSDIIESQIKIKVKNGDLTPLIDKVTLSSIDAEIDLEASYVNKDINCDLLVSSNSFSFNGYQLIDSYFELSKNDNNVSGKFFSDNDYLNCDIGFWLQSDDLIHFKNSGNILECNLNVNLYYLDEKFLRKDSENSGEWSGFLTLQGNGSNLDNIVGVIDAKNISYKKMGRNLDINSFSINATKNEEISNIIVSSDWLNGEIEGKLNLKQLQNSIKGILSHFLPDYIKTPVEIAYNDTYINFDFIISQEEEVSKFFKMPVTLLSDLTLRGNLNSVRKTLDIGINLPYLLQGKDKIIHDTRLVIEADALNDEFSINGYTVMPVKKGEMELELRSWGKTNEIFNNISFLNVNNPDFYGKIMMQGEFPKNPLTNSPFINVSIYPSTLHIGAEEWKINRAGIHYNENVISVNDLKIWHDNQKVEINGIASKLKEDELTVELEDIDVDYIFDTLNINYVDFGGTATGLVKGKGLLGAGREASTDYLYIKDLSYNETVIGDGDIKGEWDEKEKKVSIYADIIKDSIRGVKGFGGIWLGKDSLSFDLEARRAPVGFIKPFIKAFSSDISGEASGKIKLFGTFKDIDMIGDAVADNVNIKLDYTNTYYHGSDSLFFNPGEILIPGFKVHDKYGNSAIFSGNLTHSYFHNPRFNFRVTDLKDFLCYETNSGDNPDWYGTFFCSGSALIDGDDDKVNISVDVTVEDKSNFTFVLNEMQMAEDYHFLTFTDKKKTTEIIQISELDRLKEKIARKNEKDNEWANSSNLELGIRATVTPAVTVNLIMDPKAGDKITAQGQGALQIDYHSLNDELLMFGRYEINEGNYNFSLQDLILRDFKIKEGSSISFNGDPLRADLNITASYRVNTNLSDLDKSFSTDRDLNRTNVPVDALLMVKGETINPEITFDIALPTLTEDVERKVKSIISTDDMMNRQIIYLLALNKFYTPEYMGSTSNGGELSAVASTTLSSQISNLLGQLTDKFTLSPSFRSDKGDFSDIEVDVALSSSLLNNRLLVNGNFGYRDKATSNTTFIGDFDIEYLLNQKGNLRLKAYNHFNDQNYYLRSALTTQGLGIIFKKDFDTPAWLRKKKENLFNIEETDVIEKQ